MSDVENTIAMHRERNKPTWDAVRNAGMSDGDTASIDLFFFTRDKHAAEKLAIAIQERFGYNSALTSQGWFRKTYCVEVVTNPVVISLDTIDEISEKMIRIGDEFGIEFDGWGIPIE